MTLHPWEIESQEGKLLLRGDAIALAENTKMLNEIERLENLPALSNEEELLLGQLLSIFGM
jgi:hypothetical protein